MDTSDKLPSRNQPIAEPAIVVDLGHGRWTIDYGVHEGHEALFFEPAPAPGPTMTPAPAFAPPDMVQPGTVCIRFDVPEAMTFLRWWLARVQDPLRTPADPAYFAGAKWIRAFPAEHEDHRDASAISRALAMHDALPDEHRPTDSEPLRNCLPGIWPTVGDLRAAIAERDDLARHRAASEAPGWTYQGPHSAGAHLSDAVVAGRVRMLMPGDLDSEGVCLMARDRIRDLSREVARQRDLLGSRLPEGDALRILVEVGPTASACRMVVPEGMTFDEAAKRVEAAKSAIGAELAERDRCPFARDGSIAIQRLTEEPAPFEPLVLAYLDAVEARAAKGQDRSAWAAQQLRDALGRIRAEIRDPGAAGREFRADRMAGSTIAPLSIAETEPTITLPGFRVARVAPPEAR